MGKIIEGHTFDEYQEKHGKKFNKGKLQFVKIENKNKLDFKKNYWLIKDKNPGYYQVSNINYVIPAAILGVAAVVTAIVVPCTLLIKCSYVQEVNVFVPSDKGLTFSNQKAHIGQDFDTNISVDTRETGGKVLPDTLKSVISGNAPISSEEYTYKFETNKEKGSLHIPGKYIEGDVTIDFDLVSSLPWYLDNAYLNGLKPSDVGNTIQQLEVNGVLHNVRLIGVDEDYLDEEKQNVIHTTWEFATLLSDANGHSITTQWDDSNDMTPEESYLDSTIRKALNGTGDADHFLWAEKQATTWSSDYITSVLQILDDSNPGFMNSIKAPYKTVKIWGTGQWEDVPIEEGGKYDKLFLLSPSEINGVEGQALTDAYTYYQVSDDTLKERRIKAQVNKTDYCNTYSTIPSTAEHYFFSDVSNYAGYNYDGASNESGGMYWLRSPLGMGGTCSINNKGEFNASTSCNSIAYSICPAFCI